MATSVNFAGSGENAVVIRHCRRNDGGIDAFELHLRPHLFDTLDDRCKGRAGQRIIPLKLR